MPAAASAARYAALLEPRAASLQEERATDGTSTLAPKSELQRQAHWFAGDFGNTFVTVSGEPVEIVQFGTWNHESGPDFRDAAVRFPGRPDAPTVRGAIELDLDREDWERHGHATNPAFDDVVLHLFFRCAAASADRSPPTFFTRNSRHDNIPQVKLDPRTHAAQGALTSTSPDQLLPAAKPGRCLGPLRELSAARAAELLAAAARHRLERKVARWQRAVAARGFDEALFTALAAALGYKENQLPFTLLAQRLSLRTLRAEESRAPGAAVSLLLGLAGFLEAPEPGLASDEHARETRAYLRARWENWWTRRDALARLTLPRAAWKLSGLRPDNHPQRRLAALAAIARHWPRVRALAESENPARDVPRVLGELSDPFWNHHATLKSARSPQERALIGETRATEILANIFFPLAVADAAHADSAWAQYAKLPAKLSNRRVETAATRLFGGAAAAKPFLKTVVHQQGLLQIYEDFCLRDASDCARCMFPERVERFGWDAQRDGDG